MSLLGNILGNNSQTPVGLVQNLRGNNQLLQLFSQASKVKDPKGAVINMLQSGQVTKEQFMKVKEIASSLGLDGAQLNQLERFLK
jgi:hypothetical protein